MAIVFAFGPDDSFFMQTPHGRIWHNLPKHLENHLKGESDIESIETIYWMMLPGDRTYRMGWKDVKGVDRMTLPDKANNKRLSKFDDWANNLKYKHIMPRMRVTLGSDDAFWASCNGTDRWYYIPKRAEEKLQAGRDPDLSDFPAEVKLVALGYGHSYFIAFEDRTSSWKVKSNYKALDEVFDEEKKKAERVVCIAMNPFHRDQYFLTFDDGTSYWSLPAAYQDQVAELAGKLKQREGDTIRGSTRDLSVAPADYPTPPSSPTLTLVNASRRSESDSAAAPPAYEKGSAKIREWDEKHDGSVTGQKPKRKFSANPAKWCKVM